MHSKFLIGVAAAAMLPAVTAARAQSVTAAEPQSTEAPGATSVQDAVPGTVSNTETTATQSSAGVPEATPGSAQLGDIVVTAQRRSESLQRAAVSVTALSNDTLVQKGVTNATDLSLLAPALRATPASGPYVNYSIRGINNFSSNAYADSAIVVNLDGVPISHPTGSHGMFFDLERVEVLKGPQGTLYGRNATGGAINVIPAKPTFTLGGFTSVEYGSYNRVLSTGAINVPLSDTLAIRVAGQAVDRDGYYDDGTGDEHAYAVRGSLRYKPANAITLDLVGDYSREGGKGPGSSLVTRRDTLGGAVTDVHFPVDPYAGNLNQDDRVQRLYAPFARRRLGLVGQDNEFYGVTAVMNAQTSLGTVTFIPSWRATDINYVSNAVTFYVAEKQRTTQYSSEIRLASDSDHPLRYLVGAFYLHDKIDSQYVVENTATSLNNQQIHNTAETYAGFGQLTWAVRDTLRLTGALRYTHETKTADGIRRDIGFAGINPVNLNTFLFSPLPDVNAGTLRFSTAGTASFAATNYKAGVEWDLARRSLLYANVGSGFKAGGFFFGPEGSNTYKPERVTAYTLGSKNRFLDNRLQLNVEAFYYKYTDQQVSHFQVNPLPFGNTFVTDNAGKVSIYGIELEAEARVTSTTRLRSQAQYLDATYDSLTYLSPTPTTTNGTCPSPVVNGGYRIDCSGRRALQSPKWIFSGGIEQTIPLNNGDSVVLSVDSRYESSRETQLNYLPETLAPSYTRTDATVSYTTLNNQLTLTAFVQNIEDKAVIATTQVGRNYAISSGGLIGATLQAPRTFGIRAGVKF